MVGSSSLGFPYFDYFGFYQSLHGRWFIVEGYMIFSPTCTRREESCQRSQDEFSYLYFLLCWIWQSAGLHVMSVLYDAPFASNVTHIFAIYYGGVGGEEGGKITEKFYPGFPFKVWLEVGSTLPELFLRLLLVSGGKKLKKMKPSTQLDWGHEGRHKICFTAVNFDYHNNGPKLFFLKRLKRTFSQAFCRPFQCRPLNTVMFEHKSVSNRAQCVQFFNPSKEHVQSHVFQFYQVASPGDVTAPSKTKVNSAT